MYGLTLFALVLLLTQLTFTQKTLERHGLAFLDEEFETPYEDEEKITQRFGEDNIFEQDGRIPNKDQVSQRFRDGEDEDISPRFGGEAPMVGLGLMRPIANALTHQARAVARLNGWALHNKLEANKFRHNLRRVARPFHPNPFLRIIRETPKQQDNWMRTGSIKRRRKRQADVMQVEGLETLKSGREKRHHNWMRMEDLTNEFEAPRNQKRDWIEMNIPNTEFGNSKNHGSDWMETNGPNMENPRNQRGNLIGMNEQNMETEQQGNWMRMKGPNMKRDEELFVWSLNYPGFYRVAELPQLNEFEGNPEMLPSDINQDFRTNLRSNFDQKFREANQFSTTNDNFEPFREALPEPHFHYLHKLFTSHYHKKYGPSQVTINNQHTSINNFQSDHPHHGLDESHGSFGGHSKQPAFASFENSGSVTINNQDNKITPTGGNIQIAQTTGHAASSQASNAGHSGNIQISQTTSNAASSQANHIVALPYLIHVPFNRKRYRRSLPLVSLLVNPNSKLDMPQTLQNVGTIARKSFEDQRAPMYHIRNVMGSLKNAVLSTLKIAPQDLIIPSQYKIVDAKEVAASPEIVAAAAPMEEKARSFKERWFQKMNPKSKIDELQLKRAAYAAKVEPRLGAEAPSEDPYNFLGTFQKVGAIFRDSVRSSQEVMQHISDAAHSARKAYTTSKTAAPRILLTYSKAPVLQKPPSRLTMIGPRFLDVNDNDANDALKKDDEMVKIGDLMDAIGLSHPEGDRVGLRKITIQKHPKFPLLASRFGNATNTKSDYIIIGEDIDENDLGTNMDDAWKSLEDIKSAVGVNTVKGFLQEMKEDFKRVREKVRSEREAAQNDELSNFFKKLFSPSKSSPNLNLRFQNEETGQQTATANKFVAKSSGSRKINDEKIEETEIVVPKLEDEETVGAKMLLPENLWHPFMNQAARSDVEKYFKDNGDDLESFERSKIEDSSRKNVVNFEKLLGAQNEENMDEEQKARMKFHAKLLKPYMGKIKLKHGGYFDKDDYGYPFGEVYDQEYYE